LTETVFEAVNPASSVTVSWKIRSVSAAAGAVIVTMKNAVPSASPKSKIEKAP